LIKNKNLFLQPDRHKIYYKISSLFVDTDAIFCKYTTIISKHRVKIYILTKQQRIDAFVSLGEYLLSDHEELKRTVEIARHHNAWFTPAHVRKALDIVGRTLSRARLTAWLAPYPFHEDVEKTVGLILAGNIPLVGFHDILCALCAGFSIRVKTAADDPVLTRHVLEKLIEIEPRFSGKIHLVDRLNDFDLVIATGSDNSARYFHYYFGKKPHIIRKNRNSVAVLTGQETIEDIRLLGNDIFDYFGLGCRSVSKVFIPAGYDVSDFFEGIAGFSDVINHHKYVNNYDYNKSIYLINGDTHYDNGFLLLKPDPRTASPLAVVYLEEYTDTGALTARLNALEPMLQCIVGREPLNVTTPVVEPGHSQEPALDDYADRVNTLDFLAEHR